MRKLVLGMLLAAGAALPALAATTGSVQDRPQEAGQHREHDGEQPRNGAGNGGARPEQPRPAPQAAAPVAPRPQAPAAPTQVQAQAPAPAQARAQAQPGTDGRGDGGRFRGNDAARFNGGDFNRGDPNRDGREVRPDANQPARNWRGDPDRGAPQPGYRGPQGGPGYAPDRGQFDGRGPQPQYRQQPGQGQFRQGGGNPGSWNRGWRGDTRYDWGRYRAQNGYAFHLPRYDAPRGWRYGYRRFSPGFTLYAGLFDQGFWIGDPYAYRLPPAYYPDQWVRYYNDALLVDVRTGYVIDTVYDIFW